MGLINIFIDYQSNAAIAKRNAEMAVPGKPARGTTSSHTTIPHHINKKENGTEQ
jgi:hypothetical protein